MSQNLNYRKPDHLESGRSILHAELDSVGFTGRDVSKPNSVEIDRNSAVDPDEAELVECGDGIAVGKREIAIRDSQSPKSGAC